MIIIYQLVCFTVSQLSTLLPLTYRHWKAGSWSEATTLFTVELNTSWNCLVSHLVPETRWGKRAYNKNNQDDSRCRGRESEKERERVWERERSDWPTPIASPAFTEWTHDHKLRCYGNWIIVITVVLWSLKEHDFSLFLMKRYLYILMKHGVYQDVLTLWHIL